MAINVILEKLDNGVDGSLFADDLAIYIIEENHLAQKIPYFLSNTYSCNDGESPTNKKNPHFLQYKENKNTNERSKSTENKR